MAKEHKHFSSSKKRSADAALIIRYSRGIVAYEEDEAVFLHIVQRASLLVKILCKHRDFLDLCKASR